MIRAPIGDAAHQAMVPIHPAAGWHCRHVDHNEVEVARGPRSRWCPCRPGGGYNPGVMGWTGRRSASPSTSRPSTTSHRLLTEDGLVDRQRRRLLTRMEQLRKQHEWGDISDDEYRAGRADAQAEWIDSASRCDRIPHGPGRASLELRRSDSSQAWRRHVIRDQWPPPAAGSLLGGLPAWAHSAALRTKPSAQGSAMDGLPRSAKS